MTRAITFWNDSGGVGKTTMAVNSAAILSRRGYRVLVIDLDPQEGGLTDHVGFKKLITDDYYDIADVMLDQERSLDEIILDQEEVGLPFDLIPSNKSLTDFGNEVAVNYRGNRDTILRWELNDAGIPDEYDAILVDARASKGTEVSNAIVATRNVVVPTEVSPKGDSATNGLQGFVQDCQRGLERDGIDADLGIVCVIPNQIRNPPRTWEMEALGSMHLDLPMPVTPFVFWDHGKISEAWKKHLTFPEFRDKHGGTFDKERNETTYQKFEYVADIVESASLDGVDYEEDITQRSIDKVKEMREDNEEAENEVATA